MKVGRRFHGGLPRAELVTVRSTPIDTEEVGAPFVTLFQRREWNSDDDLHPLSVIAHGSSIENSALGTSSTAISIAGIIRSERARHHACNACEARHDGGSGTGRPEARVSRRGRRESARDSGEAGRRTVAGSIATF